MARRFRSTALAIVLIVLGGCGEDDFGDARARIAPETLVAMSERHMDGSRSYDLIVRKDSTAILGTLPGNEESWTLTPETRDKVVSAIVEGGFARMKREYDKPDNTCGSTLLISLNDGRFHKTVRAMNADTSSEDVWKIAERVRELLGVDAIRERLNQR